MNKTTQRLLPLLGGFIFLLLFSKAGIGINLLLFALIILPAVVLHFPHNMQRPIPLILGISTVATAGAVVWHHSQVAYFAFLMNYVLFLGFAFAPSLRFTFFAGIHFAHNQLFAPLHYLNDLVSVIPVGKTWKRYFAIARLTIIPLIVLFVFFVLYNIAIPEFASLTVEFIFDILVRVIEFLSKFDIDQMVLLLFGIVLFSAIFYYPGRKILPQLDSRLSEIVKRKRQPVKKYSEAYYRPKMMGLKRENLTGILLLSMLNVLLSIVLYVDITTVWFGYEVPSAHQLSQFVHSGTTTLIVSILLSMAIILYLFRKNQNFYPKNKTLRQLAFVWIGLNALLVLAVAIRNYHFFSFYGLTEKRIGVFIFLLLTLAGLFTLILKITQRKSLFYLLKVNSWAAVAVLITAAFVNWHGLMLKQHMTIPESRRDYGYMLTLTPQSLPLLQELDQEQGIWPSNTLDWQIGRYLKAQQNKDWRGWNYLDYKITKQLKTQQP